MVLYVVWGSTYLAIRVAVETMPPFLMAGTRFVLAGTLLILFVMIQRGFHATWKQWIDSVIASFLMLLAGNGLVCWAEQEITSSIATLLVSANPFMFVIAEWFVASRQRNSGQNGKPTQGDRPSVLTMIGLVMGFVGLYMLVLQGDKSDASTGFDLMRVLAIFCACACWTVGSLYTRYSAQPTDPFSGASMQMLCGGVWLLLAGTLLGEWSQWEWNSVSRASIGAWLYLVVAGSLIAYTTYLWAMKHCSPTLVSTYAYVNPIVAVFLGWWLLNEEISWHTIAAAACIVAGVAVVTWSKVRK